MPDEKLGAPNFDDFFPSEAPGGVRKSHKRSSKKDLEGPVVKECLSLLKSLPEVLYVERRNTGAVQFPDGRFVRFGVKGGADLWCLIATPLSRYPNRLLRPIALRHVEVECKRRDGKGKQSAEQKTFEQHCGKIGVPYLLVTSAEDLRKKLACQGFLRG